MGKSKNKNRTEVEHLKGIIRQLKSELKYYKRRSQPSSEYDEEIDDQEYNCPNCGKGNLSSIDLKYIIIHRCDICGYAEKEKPKL